MEDKIVYIAQTISLAFLKVVASPQRFIPKINFQSNSSSKTVNKPRNKREHPPLQSVKLRESSIFQCYYSRNSTKGTESEVIHVSQMLGIELRPQTAAPGIL